MKKTRFCNLQVDKIIYFVSFIKMKFVYGFVLFVILIMLVIIYFTNVVYLSSTYMYLFNTNSTISTSVWLLIIMILSVMFWAVLVLFIKSFFKWKPKDIFEDDF